MTGPSDKLERIVELSTVILDKRDKLRRAPLTHRGTRSSILAGLHEAENERELAILDALKVWHPDALRERLKAARVDV